MHRRKQGPKEETSQLSEVTSAITFAFLSVSPTDAKGTNFVAQLATAARSMFEQQQLWKLAEQFFQGEMGCMGRLLKVLGDLQPAASYLILAPCAAAARLAPGSQGVYDSVRITQDPPGTCRLVAPSPFFNTQWRQHRNGSECVQLFAELATKHATAHAIISRADFSAEAKKLSLRYGSDLKQVLAQVQSGSDADDKLPLEQCTAGCTMIVPADGMVFMVLLTVSADDTILYNLVT